MSLFHHKSGGTDPFDDLLIIAGMLIIGIVLYLIFLR